MPSDVKLHDNADVSAAVNVSGDSAVNDDETSDAQLLADDEDLLLESRVNSLVAACDRVSEERVNVSGLVREDGVEKSVDERSELLVLSDEVRLGVDLDHSRGAVSFLDCDDALSGDSLCLLSGDLELLFRGGPL